MRDKPKSVDAYLDLYPNEVKERLIQIRKIIFDIVPDVKEKIGYGMPSYKAYNRQFMYFSAFSSHIGLYCYPNVYIKFKNELKNYKTGTGSVQFPHDKKLPTALIKNMIKFRFNEMKKI